MSTAEDPNYSAQAPIYALIYIASQSGHLNKVTPVLKHPWYMYYTIHLYTFDNIWLLNGHINQYTNYLVKKKIGNIVPQSFVQVVSENSFHIPFNNLKHGGLKASKGPEYRLYRNNLFKNSTFCHLVVSYCHKEHLSISQRSKLLVSWSALSVSILLTSTPCNSLLGS